MAMSSAEDSESKKTNRSIDWPNRSIYILYELQTDREPVSGFARFVE